MTAMVIDSGVGTVADLLALLPPSVAATVDHDTLREADFASALRMLATIQNPGWHQFIRMYTVDWAGLLPWARTNFSVTNSVRVRVEIAASLAGNTDAQASLRYGARALDETNYAAFMDALVIARRGVSR